MINIALSDLEKILLEVKSAKPVTFVAITDARANKNSVEVDPTTGKKTPNPYDKILKKTRVNGFIGYDYEAAVNRQRVREGGSADFVAQERSWGNVICPAMSEKDGRRYLRVKVQSYLETEYFGVKGDTMTPITKDEAKKFIREKKPSTHQGVEKEIDHKEYLLSNVEQLNMDGESYTLLRG